MPHRPAARLASALVASSLLALAGTATVSAALGAQTTHRTTAAKSKSTKATPARSAAKSATAAPTASAARDSVYTGVQVDTLAEPDPTTFAPRYPAALRARQVSGTVVVQFVVDTNGRAQMPTFKVLSSSDTAFTTAVRTAVARTTFLPALLDGRKVRQLYEQPFTFAVDSVSRAAAPRR